MTAALGVSLGIMRPDAQPVLVEGRCPECLMLVRDVALGLLGECGLVTMKCECGTSFTIHTTARELDS